VVSGAVTPTWSTVVVAGAAMFLELLPGHGIPLYVADPAGPCAFLGARWTKGLRFTARQWQTALAEQVVPATPILGRVFRWNTPDETWRRGPRDADVVLRYAAELNALAIALAVPHTALGVCGSALYKPRHQRGDFDFIVFEDDGWSRAAVAARRLARDCPTAGVPYHLRFRLPDIASWCDPHFTGRCSLAAAIITGQARPVSTAALSGEQVATACHGHYLPAHYELASGLHLVSFRFGHSGLFAPGDRIAAERVIPRVTWQGVTSFVICDGSQYLEVVSR
jgi:hypothetical protein